MGGPKWIAPPHGPSRQQHKRQRSRPERRQRLEKELGLPKFGKFEPDRIKKRRLGLTAAVGTGAPSAGAIASLQLAAKKAEEDYNRRQELERPADDGFVVSTARKCKDPSYRAYYKEFRKVVEQSDVLLEVLDARDPLGCRCVDVERSVLSEFNGEKRVLLVLNKVDLVPREAAEQWLAHLRADLPVVAFTALKGPLTHKCTECLHRLLTAQARTGEGGRRRITVGVIGYPNVGKSSVINALKREVVVAVGNTPGFTKRSAEVQLNSHVTILDCPGIVFSGSDSGLSASVLRNMIKVETVDDPIAPVELILQRCDAGRLQELYGLPEFKDVTDFLTKVALKKGKIGKRCEPMLDDAARLVLKDWNDGAIPFFTMPLHPPDRAMDDAAVPTEFQREYEALVVQGLPVLEELRSCAKVTGLPVKYETGLAGRARRSTKKSLKRPRGQEEDDAASRGGATGSRAELSEGSDQDEDEDGLDGEGESDEGEGSASDEEDGLDEDQEGGDGDAEADRGVGPDVSGTEAGSSGVQEQEHQQHLPGAESASAMPLDPDP